MSTPKWTQSEAKKLCIELEAIAPDYGAHIALSGGCVYKEGERKDCDIIIYRIRQAAEIDFEGFFKAAEKIGVMKVSGFGFCYKATHEGRKIDFLSPEEEEGEYSEDSDDLKDDRPLRLRAEDLFKL